MLRFWFGGNGDTYVERKKERRRELMGALLGSPLPLVKEWLAFIGMVWKALQGSQGRNGGKVSY